MGLPWWVANEHVDVGGETRTSGIQHGLSYGVRGESDCPLIAA